MPQLAPRHPDLAWAAPVRARGGTADRSLARASAGGRRSQHRHCRRQCQCARAPQDGRRTCHGDVYQDGFGQVRPQPRRRSARSSGVPPDRRAALLHPQTMTSALPGGHETVAGSIDRFRDRFARITQQVGRRIVGHEDIVNGTVTSLLAGGHVLLEGIPGVGKTSLVHTLADVLHLKFSRIQFTPDLMPADIVGTNIVQEHSHGGTFFEFQPGPIFANVVLADEINRATPKTQSALLEAMQDVSVSVGKTTYKLEQPFLVLATQNPLEMEGTYPLPEAQLDRFFFKL